MGIRFAALMMMTLGLNAYACPEIAGHFTCSNDASKEVQTMAETGQFLTFTVNDEEMIADNQDHEITGDPTFRHGTEHTSCTQSAIKREVIGDFYEGDVKIGGIHSITEYSLVEGSLVETTTGTMNNGKGDIWMDDRITCSRDAD